VAGRAPQRLLHRRRPVRGDATGTRGGVTGVIYDNTEQDIVRVPHTDHAHLWIDWPRVTDDVRIARAGMRKRETVLRSQATIEGDFVFMPITYRRFYLHSRRVCCDHCFGDLLL